MVTCRDVYNLKLDGVELVAGEKGLGRIVSWFCLVQAKPYKDHMYQGNFALIVIDGKNYDFEEALKSMGELDELGVSGLAVSIVEDRETIPQSMIDRAEELALPLFWVRWGSASVVDISQSIGNLITETNVINKRTGDYLYNLLFGYDVNDRYIKKISAQFGLDFSRPYRVGIIVVDRKYGTNLEQDEHVYEYYANCLNREVLRLKGHPMFMRFLNKFVLLFEARKDRETEHELGTMLGELDDSPQFKDLIKSTCILGNAYADPAKLGQSYQEAKSLIARKDLLPNPLHKKVLSASAMGIYRFMFHNDNQSEVLDYCNEKLDRIEKYDHANGTLLQETLVAYYMNGFNTVKTAESLFIHRNSLLYRLKKAEELLEIELTDYAEYLDLINCILVKKLMFL